MKKASEHHGCFFSIGDTAIALSIPAHESKQLYPIRTEWRTPKIDYRVYKAFFGKLFHLIRQLPPHHWTMPVSNKTGK